MLKVSSNNSIYITRGDSAVIALNVTDSEGAAYDFSNDTVKFTVKKNCQDRNAVIEKVFDENGQIALEPADTEGLTFGDYWYDVQLTHTENDSVSVDTIIVPTTFTVGAEVSW